MWRARTSCRRRTDRHAINLCYERLFDCGTVLREQRPQEATRSLCSGDSLDEILGRPQPRRFRCANTDAGLHRSSLVSIALTLAPFAGLDILLNQFAPWAQRFSHHSETVRLANPQWFRNHIPRSARRHETPGQTLHAVVSNWRGVPSEGIRPLRM